MRMSVRFFHLSATIVAFFAALQSASAVPTTYRFWEGGWPDGGIVTGTIVIDEQIQSEPGLPGYCFRDSVSSFDAYWSGNAFSDPYNWGIGDISGAGAHFMWRVSDHRFFELDLSPYAPVFLMGSTLVDNRHAYEIGGSQYYVQSAEPIHVQAVPDGGPTLLYLGVALVFFAPFLRRQKRVKA